MHLGCAFCPGGAGGDGALAWVPPPTEKQCAVGQGLALFWVPPASSLKPGLGESQIFHSDSSSKYRAPTMHPMRGSCGAGTCPLTPTPKPISK